MTERMGMGMGMGGWIAPGPMPFALRSSHLNQPRTIRSQRLLRMALRRTGDADIEQQQLTRWGETGAIIAVTIFSCAQQWKKVRSGRAGGELRTIARRHTSLAKPGWSSMAARSNAGLTR